SVPPRRSSDLYGTYGVSFGPEYFIPKPFDPRLIVRISSAVAQAAVTDGVASRPIADIESYEAQLEQFIYRSGAFMKPLFPVVKKMVRDGLKSRIVFAEGEDERVL